MCAILMSQRSERWCQGAGECPERVFTRGPGEGLTKARKDVKKILEERYQTQDKVTKSISAKDKTARAKAERYATGVNYFFKKLRF